MEKTANYKLPQWSRDDFIKMDDFNAAFAGIDTQMKKNADAAAKAADAESVTALQTDMEAIAKSLGTHGHNCRIAFGSYTGTDTYGTSAPTALTFDFYPVVVIVAIVSASPASNPSIFVRGRDIAAARPEGSSYSTLRLTWSDHGVSWYNTNANKSSSNQLNADAEYCYVVLGYEKPTET